MKVYLPLLIWAAFVMCNIRWQFGPRPLVDLLAFVLALVVMRALLRREP